MTDGQEYVTHVIKFDPELTENQHKAMGMALELAYMNGRLDECGDIINALTFMAENYVEMVVGAANKEEEQMSFIEAIAIIQDGLGSRGQEIIKTIEEMDVNAS